MHKKQNILYSQTESQKKIESQSSDIDSDKESRRENKP